MRQAAPSQRHRPRKPAVKSDERFLEAQVAVRVNKGEAKLTGSFLGYRDASILKHKVAEIEGVVDIEIRAAFLARQAQ